MGWILSMILVGTAGWALAEVMLHRAWRNGSRRDQESCAYCGWGLNRTSGYEVYRWEGQAYCSLSCLRRDGELREREGRLA